MALSQPANSGPVVLNYGDLAVELCSFSYGDGIWLLFAVFKPVFSLIPLPLTTLLSKSCELQRKLLESMSYHAFPTY